MLYLQHQLTFYSVLIKFHSFYPVSDNPTNISNSKTDLFCLFPSFHVSSPYLTCAMSPTTISETLIWMSCPPRITVNFCSCSMRLWRPLNCFSLLQSLKAVTRTTHTTDSRMAAPSIHPVSASPSSSTPPAALPQSEHRRQTKQEKGSWIVKKEHKSYKEQTAEASKSVAKTLN